MNSSLRKKILLAVLLAVLVYVWWNGFHTMYPETSSFVAVEPLAKRSSSSAGAPAELAFREPKTNPFFRPTQQPGDNRQQRPALGASGTAPLLHSTHKLIGVLKRGSQSQAVISQEDRTRVISLGDSVSAWELIMIGENHAVFKHDKQRDTLWLYEAKK